jgi:AAA15 family ATPase/GTPase
MFIKFEFGNFRSFRDKQVFSMEAMRLRPNDNRLGENNVFESAGLRLLKSKAIFGGNASGKSNLAKAIAVFQMMVDRSVAQEDLSAQVWNDRFQLVTDWDDQPVFFQYFFLMDGIIYRYGFQVLGTAISYEWLYAGSEGGEIEFFLRGPDGMNVNHEAFPNADQFFRQRWEVENELYRTDSLFLTAAALYSNKILGRVRAEIRNIISVHGVYNGSAVHFAIANYINGSEEKKKALIDLLAAADTGVEDLLMDELPDHLANRQAKSAASEKIEYRTRSLISLHSVYDWDGNKTGSKLTPFGAWESEGTGKLLGIGAVVLDALAHGGVIVVDEFDASLHPNLLLKLVELFQEEKTNPHQAQLIFITHDSGLLRRADLRRDQICFVNKDRYGVSSAVNLVEFKGVRKDASYDKEYLNGTYTGIPYLDRIGQVVVASNENDGLQEAG